MEQGEAGTRQSGIPPVSSITDPYTHQRRHSDRPYREGATMATATLISPSNAYQPYHAPSFSSGYHTPLPPPPSQTSSIHSMVSPADPPRRTSNEPEIPHRQSLPSIQEVIQGAKGPRQYPQSAPPTGPPAPSLPSPFSATTPNRPYGDAATDPNPSPRTLHPTTNFPRPEPAPAFSDPARHSVSTRPAPPPLNTFPTQHPSPPRNEPEPRHPEPHSSYPHPTPPVQPILYAQSGQLPPGQLPLTGYNVSPRQAGHALPSPYDAQRPPIYEEGDYQHRPNEYKTTVDRAFEAWSYGEALNEISTGSRTVFGFADAFDAAAREQQGQRSIPSRLPLESEVTAIIDTVMHVKKKLEEVRDMVQQNRLNHERAQANGGRKPFEDEDVTMYNDGMKPPFALNEVKKRRGRAAPPGRCHSCNRVDTPEWRRGPDGARTLCNACGLHYAKLERKRQLEQRNIRPKPSDERN